MLPYHIRAHLHRPRINAAPNQKKQRFFEYDLKNNI